MEGPRPEDVERGGLAPEDELDPPPDRPAAVDDRLTAAEQHEGRPLGARLAEEERGDGQRSGEEASPPDLLDQGPVDDEKDLVADVQGDDGVEPEPAEEAAIHIRDEADAPGLTDGPDRYVED